jgi:SAM-dependent methyltransferase
VKVFDLAGHDASGLEPGLEFQRFSAERLRAQVHRGNLRDFKPQAPFDLVLFIHVIEHLPSPRQALQAIHRLLKPGGRLYLECPSLGKKCTRLSDQFHFAHIHTFTPIPLLTLLKQCGFAVEHCYSDGVGLNHKFLLTKTAPAACPIDPAGVEQTRAFAATYVDPWRRVKSLDYFKRRCRRISIYLKEFLWGASAVRGILQRVQQQRPLAAAG